MSENEGANYTPGMDTGETISHVVHPYAERLIKRFVGYFADHRPIKALIRDLDPDTVAMLYQTLPGIGGFLVSKVPDSAFKSVEAAHMVRSLGLEAAKAVADVLKDKKEASEKDLAEAVDAAIKRTEEMTVIVDQMDHYHLADCAKVAKLPKRIRTEIAFKGAVDQGLKPAACCYERVEGEKAKVVDPKKSRSGRNLSPLDIIGAADEELRQKFIGWLDRLSVEDRTMVMDRLHELDSFEEFVGFMELPEEMRIQMMPLLENRHARFSVKQFLGIVGEASKSGLKELKKHLTNGWAAYKAWDDTYAPKVAEAKRRLAEPRSKKKRKVKWNWRMFLPF